MRGMKEKLYVIPMALELPDGGKLEIDIIYKPLMAFEIAKIYDGVEKDLPPEEQFRYLAVQYSQAVQNWRFANVPRGAADYENGELSVRDLTWEQREVLSQATAPGLGKSAEAVGAEVKRTRRLVGKGDRREPSAASSPAA